MCVRVLMGGPLGEYRGLPLGNYRFIPAAERPSCVTTRLNLLPLIKSSRTTPHTNHHQDQRLGLDLRVVGMEVSWVGFTWRYRFVSVSTLDANVDKATIC